MKLNHCLAILLFALLTGSALGQTTGIPTPPKAIENNAPAKVTEANFRIYRPDGMSATLSDIVRAMADYDVVLLGETHDDPTAHYIQAELLRLAAERYTASSDKTSTSLKPRPLALSLEMFERDVQTVVDEYLADLITAQHFLKSSRPWRNYETDYRPLIEYAKKHHLPVIAANAPQRYVNRVSRLGPEALNELSTSAKAWLPPLPYAGASPDYIAKLDRALGSGHGEARPLTEEERAKRKADPARQYASQSLWDATMAHSIARQLQQQPGTLIIHINGRFHSEERLGIPDHLRRYDQRARLLIVTMLPNDGFPEFNAEKHARYGDFIMLTDPSLPRTFKPEPMPAGANVQAKER